MISTRLMWGTVGWYFVLMAASAWDGRWPVALYWLGAATLTLGIIAGMK